MSNESRAAFDAWWESFKSERDEWKYADSDALRWQAWQASRKEALTEASKALMGADLNGLKDDPYLLTYTVQMLSGMAAFIKETK